MWTCRDIYVVTFYKTHHPKWCWVIERWWFDSSKELKWQANKKLRKSIIQIFKKFGFKIEIKANPIEVFFLDVTFSLIKEAFWPNKNPSNNLSCINVFSNHLSTIIKRLPDSLNGLLSRKSSVKDIFCYTKEDFQKALDNSGYKSKLLYKERNSNNTNNKRKKQHKQQK